MSLLAVCVLVLACVLYRHCVFVQSSVCVCVCVCVCIHVCMILCVHAFCYALYENLCVFCLLVYIPLICIYGYLHIVCFSLRCKVLSVNSLLLLLLLLQLEGLYVVGRGMYPYVQSQRDGCAEDTGGGIRRHGNTTPTRLAPQHGAL